MENVYLLFIETATCPMGYDVTGHQIEIFKSEEEAKKRKKFLEETDGKKADELDEGWLCTLTKEPLK